MDSAQYNTAEKRLNAKEKEILDHIFSTTAGAVRHFKDADNSDIEVIDDEDDIKRDSLSVSFDDEDFNNGISKVVKMKSVKDMSGNEFAKGNKNLIEQVTEFFDSIGNVAHSKYGDVVLNKSGAKSSLGHGIGRNKAVAFTAVPDVIEQGEVIDYHKNHKSRKYDTAVFSAPVTINNVPYYMAVVVKVEKSSNSYYLHEIALQKKEDATPFKTGTDKMGTPSGDTSSIYSLLNKLQNVKSVEDKRDEYRKELYKIVTSDNSSEKSFHEEYELLKKYQNGIADKDTFFIESMAIFAPRKSRPRRAPDHVSYYHGKVSSEYWYEKDGVIRGSEHWGTGVASCDWMLDGIGRNQYSRLEKTSKSYGYARWDDFVYQKPFIEISGKAHNLGFDNIDGKHGYNIDGKSYVYDRGTHDYVDMSTIRYSKKVDSEGNALTEAQEEYFKDSKVRDENGNLLVVYHGTDADFTVFDRTKSRSNMDIQGNFFSPWDIDARGYGPNVKAYYLNIKNPAPEGEGYKALNMYKGQNGAGIKAREYLISMGYDGVNNGNEEYIAFYPEQIKVVDNLNPTESDDVRYAKKVDEYTYDTLVSKPDMHITRIDDRKNYVPNKQTRKGIVDNALKSAISVGHKDASGNTYVYVDDIDTNILVSKRGLQHSLDRRLGIVAPVTENIGPILKNSIRINEMTPKSDTIENSYVLIGIAKNGKNEPYVVSFVVNKASNEITSVDVLYAVNAKTEPVGSLSPELSSRGDVSLTGSDISISDLLDYVNKYYPDVLPEDVLKHYGYDRRPNGKLGDSALYSKRVEPVNDNLLNELNDAYQQARKTISEQRQQLIKDKYTKMRLEQETKPGRHISVTRAKAINNILKKRYNSKLDSTVGTRDILRLYDAYIEKGTSDDTVMQMAEDVAKAYLLNVKAEKTLDSYAKTVLDDLRGMRITLSPLRCTYRFTLDIYGLPGTSAPTDGLWNDIGAGVRWTSLPQAEAPTEPAGETIAP